MADRYRVDHSRCGLDGHRSLPQGGGRERASLNCGWLDVKFLLLQGPIGGFFGYFARHLRAHGHEAVKFDFNFGDRVFSWGSGALRVAGNLHRWDERLRVRLVEDRPDAVVVFGDERPVHRVAARAAKEMGIAFFSFEEGYFRPHYVTLERDGNNANSPLPRDPAALADLPEPITPRALPSAFGPVAWRATAYYSVKTAAALFWPPVAHHRKRDPFSEGLFWTLNYTRALAAESADALAITRLTSDSAAPFYLAALQVHDDLQLVRHGKGWHHGRFLPEVIGSFARHAPPGTKLVVKVHPMDRGHHNYRAEIRDVAHEYGVSARVVVLETGPLAALVRRARGLVTVNSTSGLTALMAGVPVIVLGEALYVMPGLARQAEDISDVDRFWSEPQAPDAGIAERFRRTIIAQTQIPGSYYLKQSWLGIAEAAEARITAALAEDRKRPANVIPLRAFLRA